MKKKKFKSMFFTKVVFSYFAFLLIVISIFLAIIYRAIILDNRNTAMKNQQELTNRMAQQVDSYISDIDQIAQQVMRAPSMLSFFYNLQNDKDITNYFDTDALNQIELSTVLRTINGPRSSMHRVSVYNQYGDFISTGAFIPERMALQKKLLDSEIYNRMITLAYSDTPIITNPQPDYWSSYYNGNYVSVYRPLMNVYSKAPCGIVEVQCSIKGLEKLFEFNELENISVLIYDKDDNLIYPESSININADMYTTKSYTDNTDWKITLVQTEKSINAVQVGSIAMFVTAYIILIAFIFFINYIVAHRITMPITKLRNSVAGLSVNNMKIKLNDKYEINEIKDLNETFSNIIQRLGESMQHEKKAYSLALQSQMNPHFLYNMLSVISASGMEAGNDEVVKLCSLTSSMLRYVASFENIAVPLRDEITHVKNYLYLMKARYEDCFSYEINIDYSLNSMIVPKLIVQPIIENCFQHAFTNMEPPWKISIDIYALDDNWYICVQDNGTGIDNESIDNIKYKIDEYLSNMSKSFDELKIGGLGLISTIIRLHLMLGDDIKYSIENSNPHGTVVILYGKIKF